MDKRSMMFSLVIFIIFAASRVAADCQNDIQEYIDGLNPTQPKLWSLEMLDSSVKYPQAGLFEATFLVQLGNYDECLAIRRPNDETGAPRFKGQYCHFSFGFKSPELDLMNDTLQKVIKLRKNNEEIVHKGSGRSAQPIQLPFLWAVCAPSSCGEEGVKTVADLNMATFSNILGVEPDSSITPNSCYFEEDGSKSFDANTCAFVIILASWICFSTVYEYIHPDMQINDLFKLPTNPASGQLGCLHGIRVISMMWMILGHTFLFSTAFPAMNYLSMQLNVGKDWKIAPLLNGYLSVDTFFLMSGLLVTYVPLMDSYKGRKFNILKYYVYRYLRITPALAFVMWYLASLNFYLGHGPMWYITVGMSRAACIKNWWPTLLYITNYFYANCIGQAWYLCVDMQLALLAPIVIIPLIKWPKYGLALIGLLTAASLGATFGVTYVNNYPWTIISKLGYDSGNYLVDFYPNTLYRGIPYLVGMALGYLLSTKIKIHLPKWAVALGWFLSAAICLTIVYTLLIVYDDSYVYEPVAASFYASLHKLGWALGVGWVIWACVNGYGGPVNRILSCKLFLPLSKLSFAAYLVHQDLSQYQRGFRRTPNYIATIEFFYLYSGYLILCLPLSVMVYVAIEAPIVNLLRSLFRKTTSSNTKVENFQTKN